MDLLKAAGDHHWGRPNRHLADERAALESGFVGRYAERATLRGFGYGDWLRTEGR